MGRERQGRLVMSTNTESRTSDSIASNYINNNHNKEDSDATKLIATVMVDLLPK